MYKLVVMACLTLICSISNAQTIKISGVVKDSATNEYSVAAEIYIAGQNLLALSNNKGTFLIENVKKSPK